MLRTLITLLIAFNAVVKPAVSDLKGCLDSYCKAKYQEEVKQDIMEKHEERYKLLLEKSKEKKKQDEQIESESSVPVQINTEPCTKTVVNNLSESAPQVTEPMENTVEYEEINSNTECTEETLTPGVSNTETSTSVYQPRYCELSYSETDIFAMACVVQHECGNCSIDCKRTVTCCIINRVLESKFTQNTIIDVILAPNQFPGCEYYNHSSDYPSEDTYNVVRSVISDGIDYANEATMFYNGSWSSWHESYKRVKDVDGMHFHSILYPN